MEDRTNTQGMILRLIESNNGISRKQLVKKLEETSFKTTSMYVSQAIFRLKKESKIIKSNKAFYPAPSGHVYVPPVKKTKKEHNLPYVTGRDFVNGPYSPFGSFL